MDLNIAVPQQQNECNTDSGEEQQESKNAKRGRPTRWDEMAPAKKQEYQKQTNAWTSIAKKALAAKKSLEMAKKPSFSPPSEKGKTKDPSPIMEKMAGAMILFF